MAYFSFPFARSLGSLALSLAVFAASATHAPEATAQSVPTDIMDLSLSDLMDVEVRQRRTAADENLTWYDVRRFQLDYRYLRFTFDGYRDGTTDIPDSALIGPPPPNGVTYPILQDLIVQEAHSFELGYDITRWASVFLMVPYVQQMSEHHSTIPGFTDFTIHSDGVGDLSLLGSFRLFEMERHSFSASAGLSFPTGSITKKGDTPLPGPKNQLPYTMQIGSGTYDVILSLGYQGSTQPLEARGASWLGSVGWGVSAFGKLRTGENDRGYRLGHLMIASAWLSARPVRWMEPFVRLDTRVWGKIEGNDISFPGPIYPTPVADPDNFGGEKLAMVAGLNFQAPKLPEGRFYELLSQQTLSMEGGAPVYQRLNGPQPKEIWRISVDWSWAL